MQKKALSTLRGYNQRGMRGNGRNYGRGGSMRG